MPDIKSPCVRNCCLDEDDICIGCGRSIEEIMHWTTSSNEEKKQVLQKATQRRKKRSDFYS